MNFAVKYNPKFRHFDTVDEVVVTPAQVDKKFFDLVPASAKILLNLHRYISKDIEEIFITYNELKEKYDKIIMQINLSAPSAKDFMNIFKEKEIPYMFLNYCRTIDQVYAMSMLKAKEVYIVEELGFYLNELQYFRDTFNVKLRIFPDIAQCADFTHDIVPAITKFWVRPEDLIFYQPYIDTIELYREDDRLSVVYEFYKQRMYKDKLNILILDAPDLDINGNTLDPRFGNMRINCGKRCQTRRCNLCYEMRDLANKFKSADIVINSPKMEEKKPRYILDEETGILKLAEDEES